MDPRTVKMIYNHFNLDLYTSPSSPSSDMDNIHEYIDAGAAAIPRQSIDPILTSSVDMFNGTYSAGEDALVMNFADNRLLIGVYDGIGGWKMRGVDSGQIATKMAVNSQLVFRSGKDPLAVMTDAYAKIINNKEVIGGSTTACIVIFEFHQMPSTAGAGVGVPGGPTVPTGNTHGMHMSSANLGDSGYKVFRESGDGTRHLRFQSRLQRHGEGSKFSPPFQLAALGDEYKHLPICSDDPSSAETEMCKKVDAGDIIVCATDGVWDNISEQDLLTIISDRETNSNQKANLIIKKCVRNSWKLDDISCIVVEAKKTHSSTTTEGMDNEIILERMRSRMIEKIATRQTPDLIR
jgi:serine/threonine protein phosphatase PrpC